MIDLLVRHANQRGFEVAVFTGRLVFSKIINGLQWGYGWAISREELNYAPKHVLIIELDHRLDTIHKEACSAQQL